MLIDTNVIRRIDLTKMNDDFDIEEWINKNSLSYVHEIDQLKDVKLLDMIKSPTAILFIDESQKSKLLLNTYRHLAETHHHKLAFAFIKNP